MIQTFWFVRLDEGGGMEEHIAAWKRQKCRGEVEEGDGDTDRNPVCKYFEKKIELLTKYSTT